MKKIFLVVLYKTLIQDSKTCQFIKSSDLLCDEDNTVYIWDNSPTNINTESQVFSFFKFSNVIFKHTPENVSLAKVYNTVIREYSSYDAIQIFDQDSYIEINNYNDYLNQLLIQQDDINVFLPKIYSGDSLYSPGLFFIKGFHFRKLSDGINKHRLYTAITSGMFLRLKWILENNLSFNEELQLYCIDTDFICKCRVLDSSFFVMGVDFYHDLSEENLSINEKKERRRLQIDGTKKIYKDNIFCFVLVKLYEFLLKVFRRL